MKTFRSLFADLQLQYITKFAPFQINPTLAAKENGERRERNKTTLKC